MAVKIRLARHGAKKRPYYRVVVEEVGRYNPQTTPATVTFDMEKVDTWIRNGAQPTDTVARLIETARKDA